MARKGLMQLPEYTPHAATTPPSNPDLLDQLSFEHRQIQRLWSELQLAHRRHVEDVHRPQARLGTPGQRELGRQIVQALAQHEALELELLYPTVGPVVGEAWAEHAKADHADIRELLDDLDGEDPEDERVFDVFVEVLTKAVAHIDEEERIIFPMLRAVLPSEQLIPSGQASGREPLPPHPDVIDLAATERSVPSEGREATNGKSRFRLRRRQPT